MSRARKTGLTVAIIVAAIMVLLGAAIYLRSRAAPEAARLLPEGESVLYFNLRPVRLATNFGSKPINNDPEYEEFVRQTGVQFERDLDEAAFAIHANAHQATNADEDTSRYSEVFVGRFNSEKLTGYLKKLAQSVEHYRAHDIYNIPRENRTVRVSILSPDIVAASNSDDIRQIHHIADQYDKSALPFGGPELVRDFYSEVPFGSLAWFISDVPLKNSNIPSSWAPQLVSQFLGGGVLVASLRYTSAIHLRADSFVSGDKAKDVADHLNNLLAIYRRFDDSTHPDVTNPDLKAALDSIKIESQSDRVSLTATLPRELAAKLFEAPVEADTRPQAPSTEPRTAKKSRRPHRKK
ncbi:MAG TPA: hypothetical protein VF493_16945 [Terriglobales bacterium]